MKAPLSKVVVALGCLGAATLVAAQDVETSAAGMVVQPEEGQVLDLCNIPEISVNIKINPGPGGPQFSMGTAELTAQSESFDTHVAFDEVIFLHQGQGLVTIGEETFPARPGTTMYVPRGVYHGFINTGETPWVFVWISSPPGFEDLLRQWDTEGSSDCTSSSTE